MLRKLLTAILVCVSFAGCLSCGKNASHYVYAAIPAASQLAVFREDPYSGILTQLQESPYTVGNGARSVVIHPSGKYLYVANPGQGENDISLFDINSDGTITEVTPRTPTDSQPLMLVMDPAGNYLYCANAGANTISVYSIYTGSATATQQTGSLTLVKTSPVNGTSGQGIGLTPLSMAISPSGDYLFVSGPQQPVGLIGVFRLTSGILTQVSLTGTADNEPISLAVNPAGTFLYAANFTGNSISTYSISSGTLTQVQVLEDNQKNPAWLTLDPTGSYLYVANQGSNNIGTYTITSGTGVPVPVTDSPFASEAQPSFVAADPNGKYLYIGNTGTSAGVQAFGASSGSLNSIATYSVGNGALSIAVLQ
jgi:6-phosphogluconolactonase (cycloisomerase 2 family)